MAISEAVSQMNAPYIWAILFFTMLILLGLDSEFGTLEGAVTPLVVDMKLFPNIRKEIVSGVCTNRNKYYRLLPLPLGYGLINLYVSNNH